MNRRGFMAGTIGLLALGGASGWGWRASVGSMGDYTRYAKALRADLAPDPTLRELVRYATLAPNSHNTQPWRFVIGDSVIAIRPDLSRATPAVDPDNHHLFVSLGCAAETLRIAAQATGRPGEVQIEESGGVSYVFSNGTPRPDPLFQAIPRRQSTRAEFDGRLVPASDLQTLARAAAIPGVDLILVTDRPRMGRIRDLVIAGNDAQMANDAFIRELKHWLRFNPKAAMAAGDGLFAAASNNPVLPDAIGLRAFDYVLTANAENLKYRRQIDSSAGIAVFIGGGENKAHWVSVGRACQRFALAATSLGLRCAFVNQPVEVAQLRPDLAGVVGASGRRPDLVMRFGYGPELPFSPRRPAEAVTTPV
jgi:nitroreductase